tara:strand:- start:2 stop:304 length:303 start_codon:yes stop_codon:yes gene_type:complete
MSEGYNGYTNYPTWATALWMDNEPASNEYLYELANREVDDYYGDNRILREKADILAEYVKEMLLEHDPPSGLKYDLLRYTLDVVDWQEIIEVHTEEKVEA